MMRTAGGDTAILDDEERRGRRAREQTAAGARSKAVKGLVGGVAPGDPEARQQWTTRLIPRSEVRGDPCTREAERAAAQDCAWGKGDMRQARKEMREAGKRPGSHAGIPVVKLAPWSAPGPSGDRQEHVDDMYRGCTPGQRRRLNRVLDELTVRWAINALPPTCRWMMNTHALFLRKEREPTSKEFDDDEWIQWLLEGGDEWSQPVTDADVEAVGPEAEGGSQSMDVDSAAPAAVAATGAATEEPPKVRPIQMGEWLRRWVSRRNLALNKADIEKVTVAMRQLGVGTAGGAEALALFQQVVYELWKEGRLERPLARVKIDETNCFGRLEWPAIRRAVYEALPRHFPVICWKHAAVSHVKQRDVGPMPKDQGAEQGDVDGPLECSLTLGEVSSSARAEVHGQQRRGELPWSSSAPEATSAAEREFDARAVRHAE